MSTDTSTPERVTLTAEEVADIADANHCLPDGRIMEELKPAIEGILAAREQALREEIAVQLEWEANLEFARSEQAKANGIDATHHHGQRLGFEVSARIARGGAR